MRLVRPLLACVLVVGVLALPATASEARSPKRQMVDVLNHVRAGQGAPRLRSAGSLRRSARRYARFMLARDYFGHLARIRAGSFRALGETLAIHSGWRPAVHGTMRRWMRSPGHRKVLLSRRYRLIGVGVARGRMGSWRATVWVAHVAAR